MVDKGDESLTKQEKIEFQKSNTHFAYYVKIWRKILSNQYII